MIMRFVAAALTMLLLFRQETRADDAIPPKFLMAWGQKGDKKGEFYSPIEIAINSKDEVFVTDLNNARLQKFTAEGKYVGGFELPLDTPPRKSCIIGGLALEKSGHIYLSFMNQHKLAVYTEAGQLVREWGEAGKGGRRVPSAGWHGVGF